MSTKADVLTTSVAIVAALTITWIGATEAGSAADKASCKATVESKKFAGGKTATGEHYNPHEMVAASRTLPIGSKILVRNRKTGKTATVRINDRTGKNAHNAVDLSSAAADKLGVKGTAQVDTKVVGENKKSK